LEYSSLQELVRNNEYLKYPYIERVVYADVPKQKPVKIVRDVPVAKDFSNEEIEEGRVLGRGGCAVVKICQLTSTRATYAMKKDTISPKSHK